MKHRLEQLSQLIITRSRRWVGGYFGLSCMRENLLSARNFGMLMVFKFCSREMNVRCYKCEYSLFVNVLDFFL